ncbi:MAG: ABC transporter permease [Brevinematia bacterium]
MNNDCGKLKPLSHRLYSVWYRFMRVYTKNLFSNGFEPFFEPLIFLGGIGLGLGGFIKEIDGLPYIQFLGSALLVSTAMMTSAFECSYGTFIRLEFDKAYDGIISAPISVNDLLLGEMLWAGTKGFFFSFAVLSILFILGVFRTPTVFFVPIIGFLTGFMFAGISLFVTSFVKSIDHFSFYMTGFLSPMFFFSGTVFPLSQLPAFVRPVAELLPLTHSVRLSRAILFGRWEYFTFDLSYVIIVSVVFTVCGILGIKKRLID